MNRNRMIKILKNSGLSKFQIRVLLETSRIKKGTTVTYGELAARIGKPKAYRAVGSALKINPLAPTIPCHRVTRGDGTIGNYSALGGTKRKTAMLIAEGAIRPGS